MNKRSILLATVVMAALTSVVACITDDDEATRASLAAAPPVHIPPGGGYQADCETTADCGCYNPGIGDDHFCEKVTSIQLDCMNSRCTNYCTMNSECSIFPPSHCTSSEQCEP